jgi:type I restriction enzyme S subunit
MSWNNVKLGDVVKISKGKKHSEIDYKESLSLKRYIQIEDLSNSRNQKYTCETGVEVTKQDVIIAWDGANAGKVGSNVEGVIGSTLARLRILNSNLDHNFFYRYLDSKFDFIKSQRTGATIPHVSGEALRNIPIPLPDLKTQKHIASILDKADALRQQNRQLLNYYDELLQSMFIEMFGDPVKNTRGWEVKTCGDLILKIDAGSSFGGEERDMLESELGVLKISAVTSGYFRANEYKAVPISLINDNLIFPKKGDLLFSRAKYEGTCGRYLYCRRRL